jgi:hypothetical protein
VTIRKKRKLFKLPSYQKKEDWATVSQAKSMTSVEAAQP